MNALQFLINHNFLFFLIIFAYIGAIFGSFINMLVYRLPNNLSIITPASHCPTCNHQLAWYTNIPIFSYIFLRGKCAYCKTKIPIRYLFIEMITTLLSSLLFIWYFKFSFYYNIYDLIMLYSLLFLSIPIFIIDAKHKIIPMLLIYVGLFFSISLSFFTNSTTIKDSLLGLIIGFLLLSTIRLIANKLYKKEAMGDGDPFVIAMIGSYIGFHSIIFILIVSSFLGTIFGLIYIFIKKENQIPFGPFLISAAWIYIIILPLGGIDAFNNLLLSLHNIL